MIDHHQHGHGCLRWAGLGTANHYLSVIAPNHQFFLLITRNIRWLNFTIILTATKVPFSVEIYTYIPGICYSRTQSVTYCSCTILWLLHYSFTTAVVLCLQSLLVHKSYQLQQALRHLMALRGQLSAMLLALIQLFYCSKDLR